MPNSLHRKLFATRLLLLVVLLASFHAHAAAEDEKHHAKDKLPKVITGKVIKVQDGDTITILDADRNQHRIRLAQIDAPETGQPFTKRSKEALVDKVFGKTVQVDWQNKDRNKRIIGEVRLADRWINTEMVAEGWAWHYKEYSDSKELAEVERQARGARIGLWAGDDPVPPWEWRKRRKKK